MGANEKTGVLRAGSDFDLADDYRPTTNDWFSTLLPC
jgi:hypothetical protein